MPGSGLFLTLRSMVIAGVDSSQSEFPLHLHDSPIEFILT